MTVAGLTTAPIGFLAGLGAFDYWTKYALGARRARRSLESRRLQLARLLPGQHRPQGDRDRVRGHDRVLLPRRRPPGDDLPRRARQAGHAVPRQPDLQRDDLGTRLADDLPVRDPGVRRPCELRPAADDRRPGHGVPAPERAFVLAAPDRRLHDARRLLLARRRLRSGLDGLRAAVRGGTDGNVFFNMGVQWAGRPRS